MFSDKVRQALNLCFAIAMPVVGALSNLGHFGPSMGDISARYPTYVVPAGYAFLIWTPIYALMAGYGIWQALHAQREHPLLRRIGWLSASAALACSVWIPVFQRSQFALSVAVMLWLLASLIGVVVQIYRYHAPLSAVERWLVYLNFSIFLGWITVATVANIGQTLTAIGWIGRGTSAQAWGIAALIAAGVITSLVTAALRGNAPYALTVIWALIAVAVNQFTHAVETSSTTVGAVAVSVVFLIGVTLLISRSRRGAWRDSGLDAPMKN